MRQSWQREPVAVVLVVGAVFGVAAAVVLVSDTTVQDLALSVGYAVVLVPVAVCFAAAATPRQGAAWSSFVGPSIMNK